jgi:hypothetical protein
MGTTSSVAAFAGLAIAEKSYVRSAKLLGAVEANLEAMAQLMLPSDRSEYSRNIAILREQLDQHHLDKAWKEGRAMPPEQVVEFALAQNKSK